MNCGRRGAQFGLAHTWLTYALAPWLICLACTGCCYVTAASLCQRRKPTTETIRLVHSSTLNSPANRLVGILHVFHNNRWGKVCDDGWGEEEYTVACRSLGASAVPSTVPRSTPLVPLVNHGNDLIWMDDVVCSGSEDTLLHCNFNGWGIHDCMQRESVVLECASCLPGYTYDTQAGSCIKALNNSCVFCPRGKFQNGSSCHNCSAGKFQELRGSTYCNDCAPGMFQTERGSTNCNMCEQGLFQDYPGQTVCKSCLPGRFAPINGNGRGRMYCKDPKCLVCNVGRYKNYSDLHPMATGNFTCTAGTTSMLRNRFSILQNDATSARHINGVIVIDNESTIVKYILLPSKRESIIKEAMLAHMLCNAISAREEDAKISRIAPTMYMDNATNRVHGIILSDCKRNKVNGITCPQERYVNITINNINLWSVARIECSRCVNGTSFNGKWCDSISSRCKKCAPGKYLNGSLANKSSQIAACSECQGATYQDEEGMPRCKSCPAGRHGNKTAIGKNTMLTSISNCTRCTMGKYQNLAGKHECKPCNYEGYKDNISFLTNAEALDVGIVLDQDSKCFYRTKCRGFINGRRGLDINETCQIYTPIVIQNETYSIRGDITKRHNVFTGINGRTMRVMGLNGELHLSNFIFVAFDAKDTCHMYTEQCGVSGGESSIYVHSQSILIVTNVTFEGRPNFLGRSIITESNTRTYIYNSFFQNTYANKEGAAIYFGKHSTNYIETTSFSGSSVLGNPKNEIYGLVLHLSSVSNTTIKHCDVYNNTGSSRISGMVYVGAKATLSWINVNAWNNSAKVGGVIYAEINALLSVHGSTFDGNSAIVEGGSIYTSAYSQTFVAKSVFTRNKLGFSNGKGGAISFGLSTTNTITECQLKYNSGFLSQVASLGGAIFIHKKSSTKFSKCIFQLNSAALGGAVFSNGISELIIEETEFSNNYVNKQKEYTQGGAIYAYVQTRIFIRKSAFHSNVAPAGGAVYSYESFMHVTQDSRFHNNTATDEAHGFGGSFYLRANSKLIMNDSSCTNNTAKVNGGCVYADKSSVSLHNSLCSRNRASNKGGAICAVGNSYSNGIVHSVNSTFMYNSAFSGTGIYVDYTSLNVSWSIFRANMQFLLNTNVQAGGAICIERTRCCDSRHTSYHEIDISDTLFEQNSATHGGAVLLSNGPFRGFFVRTNFVNNTATKYGGAIYVNGKNIVLGIESSVLVYNKAKFDGGGIYLNNAILLFLTPVYSTNSTIKFNRAGINGGGIAMYQSKIRFSNYVDRDQLLKAQNLDAAGQLILFHFCKSVASLTITNNFALRGAGIFFDGQPFTEFCEKDLPFDNYNTTDAMTVDDLWIDQRSYRSFMFQVQCNPGSIFPDKLLTQFANSVNQIWSKRPAKSSLCHRCQDGKTSFEPGARACVHCKKGLYGVNGKCFECQLGKFNDAVGQTSCKICRKGKFTPEAGATVCILSPNIVPPKNILISKLMFNLTTHSFGSFELLWEWDKPNDNSLSSTYFIIEIQKNNEILYTDKIYAAQARTANSSFRQWFDVPHNLTYGGHEFAIRVVCENEIYESHSKKSIYGLKTTATSCSNENRYYLNAVSTDPLQWRCEKCFDGAYCSDTAIVALVGSKIEYWNFYAKTGWWRVTETDADKKLFSKNKPFIRCWNPVACLGKRNEALQGLLQNVALQNFNESCNEKLGFRNFCNRDRCRLCGVCTRDHRPDPYTLSCKKCTWMSSTWMILLLCISVLLIALGYILYDINKSGKKRLSSHTRRVCINHYHFCSLMYNLGVTWPTAMAVMFQTQTVTSTISFDAMNCLISNDMETDFLYTKQLVHFFVPLVALAYVFCIVSLLWYFKYSKKPLNFTLVKYGIFLMYLMYPSLCRNSFGLFLCRSADIDSQVYTSSQSRQLLNMDIQEVCWSSRHIFYAMALGIPQLFIFFLGFPLGGVFVVYRLNKSKTLDKEENIYRFGLFYDGYKQKAIYWQLGIIFLKAVITFTIMTLSDKPILASYLIVLMFFFVLLLQGIVRPFYLRKSSSERTLEEIKLTNKSRRRRPSTFNALLRYNRQNFQMSRIAGTSMFICAITSFAGAFLELAHCSQNQIGICTVIPYIIIPLHILFTIFFMVVFFSQKCSEVQTYFQRNSSLRENSIRISRRQISNREAKKSEQHNAIEMTKTPVQARPPEVTSVTINPLYRGDKNRRAQPRGV